MIFKKKEKLNYFELFVEHINYSVEAAKLLKEFSEAFDEDKSREYRIKIHRLETKADQVQHKTLSYLIKDFLPPIDREDIVSLARKIDDLADHINHSILDIDILNIHALRPEFSDFTALLLQSCETTKSVLESFKNMKKYDDIQKKVIEVNKLEQKGDDLYQKSMKELFTGKYSPIEVIAWMRLFDDLEKCFDDCEDVADFVNRILLKNS